MKTALISQPFGIGDHLFAMGIAKKIQAEGYNIVWPVKKEFVEGNNLAFPDISFISEETIDNKYLLVKEDKVVDWLRIIPIRWSDAIMGRPSKEWMRTKYDLYSMDYGNWRDAASKYCRSMWRETTLFEEYGIEDGQPFNLINCMFRSNFTGNVPIKINNDYKNVEMRVIPGYSLYDYSLMIERASTIHVVNSAIFYLLEILNLSASEVHLYSRVPDEIGFPYTDYLQTKPYILHQ